MTIIEAIEKIDSLKPNAYSQSDKISWLSDLDQMIKNEIIDSHEGADEILFNGYTDDTDIKTELLVPAPYDAVYMSWLEARIDYANGEYGKYNNSTVMFNKDYSNFNNYYNRNHMPLGNKIKFF